MTQTAMSPPPGTAASAPRRWRWRWLVFGPLLLVGAAAACILDLSPVVPPARTPDAATAAAARNVLQQITGDNGRGTLVPITLSQRELDGLAALSSESLLPLRMRARLQTMPADDEAKAAGHAAPINELVIDMSKDLGWGAWVNATAIVRQNASSREKALPDMAVTLGRLPVPQWVTHWALEQMWARAQGDTARPVALASALQRFSITPLRVRLALVSPGRGAALSGLTRAGGNAPDPEALAAVYCAIADTGGTSLAVLVRRAAALPAPSGTSPQARNRIVLAAVAMRAVPEYRDKLAGPALRLIRDCGASPGPVTLAEREDLSKHWALSAALAATVGGQVARSVGTWKELADSIEGGSGFSFVDLSADRSGERFAAAALDPQLARTVHARLVAITEDQLLPPEALARPEGLDQAAFERGYTSVASPEYTRAIRTINRLLDNAGVP